MTPAKLPAELAICKWVSALLHAHYRGHFWGVQVQGGIVRIGIPALLGNWTWNIPVRHLTPQLVVKAGGDILERFNIPRSSLDMGIAQFIDARQHRVRASQTPPTEPRPPDRGASVPRSSNITEFQPPNTNGGEDLFGAARQQVYAAAGAKEDDTEDELTGILRKYVQEAESKFEQYQSFNGFSRAGGLREAGRNVEVMWLTGRLIPDHKTIADFRKDSGPGIKTRNSRCV